MSAPERARRRTRAYARGRDDARRLAPVTREVRIARYLVAVEVTDQARAYWLGVLRGARS